VNNSVFSDFLNSTRDAEERTASGKLFQAEVAAAEKAVALMVARLVREMTRVDIRDLHQRELQLLLLSLPAVSVGTMYVRLSLPTWAHSSKPAAAGLLLWRGGQEISIDCCTVGAQQQQRAAGECGQCHVVSVRRKLVFTDGRILPYRLASEYCLSLIYTVSQSLFIIS